MSEPGPLCLCGQAGSVRCRSCEQMKCKQHFASSEGSAPAGGVPDWLRTLADEVPRRRASPGEVFETQRAVGLWFEPVGAVCLGCRTAHVRDNIERCFAAAR